MSPRMHILRASFLALIAGCSVGHGPALPDTARVHEDAEVLVGNDLVCAYSDCLTVSPDGSTSEVAEYQPRDTVDSSETPDQAVWDTFNDTINQDVVSEDSLTSGLDEGEADSLGSVADNIEWDVGMSDPETMAGWPDSWSPTTVCKEGDPVLSDGCGTYCCADTVSYIRICAASAVLELNDATEVVALSRCGTTTVIGIRFVGETGFSAGYGLTVAQSGVTESLWGQHPFYQLEAGGKLNLGVWIDSDMLGLSAILTVGYVPFATQNLSPGVIFDSNGLEFYTPP